MPLPDFQTDGLLPEGIHAATLAEIAARFGAGSETRLRQINLLREIVAAAQHYPTVKRILVWGSFVTSKSEPNDLDYSIVVSVSHPITQVAAAHQRFFVPSEARRYYGTDVSYLAVYDYPLAQYIERIDFLCHRRDKVPCGIVEIHLRGEFTGEMP